MEKESSALCINDVLPRHLLTEVFIRIPSIDLLRCKIICKLWHSLLDDDPEFVGRFVLQRVRERPHLNGDEEDIHVKWNFTEMVTVTPACPRIFKWLALVHQWQESQESRCKILYLQPYH
ncbi:hypothetical protein LINPERHAP2_LOCUS24067 [Linum perenne]